MEGEVFRGSRGFMNAGVDDYDIGERGFIFSQEYGGKVIFSWAVFLSAHCFPPRGYSSSTYPPRRKYAQSIESDI